MNLRFITYLTLAAFLSGNTWLGAVMLASPDGKTYVGDQLKSFEVNASGDISATKDAQFTLLNTDGKSFKLIGQVWLGGASNTLSAPGDLPDGFAVYMRETDGLHRYQLSSQSFKVKRRNLNGALKNTIVEAATLSKPALGVWIPFSVEVTASKISYQFGEQRGVIPGPLDMDGSNRIAFAPGTHIKDLQLEMLDDTSVNDTGVNNPDGQAQPLPVTELQQPAPPVAAPNRGRGARGRSTAASTARGGPAQRRLPPNVLNSVVIIEGDQGAGSGFIAKMRDQFFIVTNQHVLSGNNKFTVTGVDGTKYPVNGALFGAKDSDVAIMKIPTAENFITVDDNSASDANIGDAVVVLGNAEGGGVATQTIGSLLGVGPKLVEVNAKFVQGNSGSPIIDRVTGKVLGLATFVRTFKSDELQTAADIPQMHWFGYRLDTIKDWEPLDWSRFSSEGQQLAKMNDLNNAFIKTIQQVQAKSEIQVTNATINKALSTYSQEVTNAMKAKNARDVNDARQRLWVRLVAVLDEDSSAIDSSKLYSFHADDLKQQMEIRKAIKDYMLSIITQFRSVEANGK